MIGTHFCNDCGGLIKFIDRKPHNEDGSSHWDICKKKQFEIVKKNGVPYKTDVETGYIYKGKRWATWIKGPRIIGEKYRQDTCNCERPPWEVCAEACAS